jgi:cysteine-rich repeat protein
MRISPISNLVEFLVPYVRPARGGVARFGPAQIDISVVLFATGVDFSMDDPACAASFCGDGLLDAGEGCEDGNTIANDGCSAECTVEVYCGDGVLDAGEPYDKSNTVEGDGCSATCEVTGDEGCTPGYWKQEHSFDSWTAALTPVTQFGSVFEDAFPGATFRTRDAPSAGNGRGRAQAATKGADRTVGRSSLRTHSQRQFEVCSHCGSTLESIFQPVTEKPIAADSELLCIVKEAGLPERVLRTSQ